MYNSEVASNSGSSFISFIFSVLSIVALWQIFKKAGKPGWASIVPFYNLYVLFEITWGNGWKMFLLLIPFYNIYVIVRICINLGRCFGKGNGFILGLIFLSPIFSLVLGFDQSVYRPICKK